MPLQERALHDAAVGRLRLAHLRATAAARWAAARRRGGGLWDHWSHRVPPAACRPPGKSRWRTCAAPARCDRRPEPFPGSRRRSAAPAPGFHAGLAARRRLNVCRGGPAAQGGARPGLACLGVVGHPRRRGVGGSHGAAPRHRPRAHRRRSVVGILAGSGVPRRGGAGPRRNRTWLRLARGGQEASGRGRVWNQGRAAVK